MKKNKKIKISIVSDENSWINNYLPKWINSLKINKYTLTWLHNINRVENGDLCFLLGCGQIMSKSIMKKNKNNLVVHESKLPKGKGWSPLSWQILNDLNNIPVALLEVDEKVDSGKIYLEDQIILKGHELVDEIRKAQFQITSKLCEKFINNYPKIIINGKKQKGKSTYYGKREPRDSELITSKTIAEQFNLFRIVDNENYPAFFIHNGKKYNLKIEEDK